jgi:hypothetical protein
MSEIVACDAGWLAAIGRRECENAGKENQDGDFGF